MRVVSSMLAVAIAAAASCAVCPQAHAGLIADGTFSDSGGIASLVGWTSTLGVGVTSEASFSYCCGGVNARTNNLAQFGGGGTSGGILSQSFATTIGQTYTLSFLYGTFGDNEPQSLLIAVGNLATSVTDPTGSSDFSNLFITESFTFTALAPISTLTFTDTSTGGSSADGLLENVAVNAFVAVPEPASLAMLGLGVASIYAARRRRAR